MHSLDLILIIHLSTIELYFNCAINGVIAHARFEVMYGYQPSTHVYRPLRLIGVDEDATNRLTIITDMLGVANQLLIIYKRRIKSR